MSNSETTTADDKLRNQLKEILEEGLEVELEPRAYEHEQILEVVSRLQKLDENDYKSKMSITGFTLTPWGEGEDEQACDTCMYYKVHRKFCEIPELMFPVEPKWSCRIWRI
jgi:repressor of nif and glnA expression